MNDQTDQQLLRAYAEHRSEPAFGELVRRHVALVHSAAVRMVCDSHLAQDVTQGVFVALAKNAANLMDRPVLSGWLHRTAQNIAAQTVRTDVRRRAREQEAATMNELLSASLDASWEHISPHLDAALGELNEADRDALLLRYFEKKSAPEMAGLLGISEEAAQKRVTRAVDRLRELFSRRKLTVGAGGLVILISANAIQAVPAGLVAAITTTALAGTAASTATLIAATKTIAMTTLQKTLVTAALATAIGTGIYEAHQAAQLRDQVQILQQQQAPLAGQIEQLQRERDEAMNRIASLSKKPAPHLPAPPMQVSASTNSSADDLPSTNLFSRFKDNAPKLTADQVEAYLKANGRKASSLLAAYRTGGDPALLKEAMEKYPNDPQVAFEAVLNKDFSPAQQRQWLDAFEKSAPDNALANYLSAYNYFTSGQIDQGIQEVTTASGKPQLQDYTLNRAQDDEEAYLSAGYSAAEAERISDAWLMVPQLNQIKQLGVNLVDLAKAYTQSGDQASAQAAFEMAIGLGQRFTDPSTDPMLLDQLVGMAIEKIALSAMPPESSFGGNGQTAQDQLNQITQNRAAISKLMQQVTPLLPTMSDQDILNYENRRRAFGEVAALQWVANKYGPQ
ncbi:MAG TPA: sigma-70 family RNA polymerase sigma factor [Candidatus Acidoferrales bacterium]|nr:sigma-70 family RNA polymerase sigma factor [Candidatus Acidoferrales bacterium]